jgi:outer membrane protein insertion porin family
MNSALKIFIILCILQLFVSPMVCAQIPVEPPAGPSSEGGPIVKAIEVNGNKTISVSSILDKIKTRVGQEYLQSVISDDLKRLYNTGYFSDVRVDRKEHEGGFKVIFYLEEKPVVDKITFSKTRYFNSRALLKKMNTQAGKFLDNKQLKDDMDTIKELYAKKGLTSVDVNAETSIKEDTNKADLHFIVKEGNKVRIKRVNVRGAKTYKPKRFLKVIKTRGKSFFNSGYLKEEILEEDMERILSFYEQNGFIDAAVDYSMRELPKGFIDIDVNVREGKRYSVGRVIVAGNNIVSSEDILKEMEEIRQGKVFSREKLTVDLSRIRALYFDKGYIFADVRESTSLNPDTGNVEVKIDVEEGGLAYVDKVKIQGNTRTRDIVIRRELRINPGDRFDGEKLRRSKERLNNLGYFEDVSFDIEDTDVHDHKDLVLQVKEAKTGSFSFGGGFSTVDKIIGFIEVEQRNFDFANWPTFTGGGQDLRLRAETGSTRSNLLLSFTEPWIFDHPVSGGFDAYKTERKRERDVGFAYDEKRVGGNIRFGKEFSEYLTGRMSYKREKVTIQDIESDVSADLLAEAGTNMVSVVSFSATMDTTDNRFNPTKGFVVNGGTDIAGSFLGGDKDFYRMQGQASYYVPLTFKSVLELRMRSGVVDAYADSENVPIFERFFAGGARSIRGYDERRVGPLDANTDDPIGGEGLMVGNVEYTIPVIDFLKLAAFFDVGNVWARVEDFGSGGFKSGTGLGLRVKTPIGPINLDYGYPITEEPGEEEKSGKFYFSVSRGF